MNKIYNERQEKINNFAQELSDSDVSIKEIAEVLKYYFSESELEVLIKCLRPSQSKEEE